MSDTTIQMVRFAYLPSGTYGKMTFPNGESFYTVEQPWNDNKTDESCIPDGVYRLGMRESPVVKRSSGGEFTEGWEVLDVPERDYIMLHPGNWPMNFKGCIGMGRDLTIMQDKRGVLVDAVTDSRDAFRRVMEIMDEKAEWELVITPFFMSYP